jgi:uncharacterized protein (AIM24 family)
MSKSTKPAQSITVKPLEGAVRVHRSAEGALCVDSDGAMSFRLEHIRSVGILNLTEVASHIQSEQAGFVSHTIHFHNGTTAAFAYNQRGQIVSLETSEGAGILIQPDGRLLFRA